MRYTDSYPILKRIVNFDDDFIVVDAKTIIRNFDFESQSSAILPGEASYRCEKHALELEDAQSFTDSQVLPADAYGLSDYEVSENKFFRYHLLMSSDKPKADQVVLMLHGLNEKDWTKYLSWGKRIFESTGKAVLFFPIAFHMNRAPSAWSDAREMYKLSSLRKEFFPNIACSSLSNAAISSRLCAKPQRFIWSGLQTYYDLIQLVEQIKRGEHTAVEKTATIDFFAYSIGAFLSQVVLMTNYKNYFEHSKLAVFCGGAVFNRLFPVSKFILDSEANVSLYSYIIEHLEVHINKGQHLKHYLSSSHPEGFFLRSMLNYHYMQYEREEAFRRFSDRVLAVVLKKDTVVRPSEVLNSLQGSERDIPVRVEEFDFPYPYTHEDPFPIRCKNQDALNESFDAVFDVLCDFLQKSPD